MQDKIFNFNQDFSPFVYIYSLQFISCFFILEMSLIKSRNWTQKEDQDLLKVLKDHQEKSLSLTWRQISDLLKQRNPLSRKTGKQCRQRWANQLDPKIKRNENWTKEENEILFKVHAEVGNKWSSICSHLPGRTDNCIKNHFYSTMRRSMRKINSYIQKVKRKTALTKTFKNEILNKILVICQGKNDNKYQFNNKAKQIALKVKNNLATLSIEFSDQDEQNIGFKQQIFHQISQFSRNCRKKKSKKQSDLSEQEINHIMDKQAEKIQISVQPIKQAEKKYFQYQEQPKNNKTIIPLIQNTKNQKQIKIPLIQLKNPNQESNQKFYGVNMRKQIQQKYQTLQKFNRNYQQSQCYTMTNVQYNSVTCLSPNLPSFLIYRSSLGFNYPTNWPLKQQTYLPFASMIQLGDNSQKYRQRSSFKIVKRSSLETQKTNSFNNS